MANNITRAVEALITAQEALTSMSAEDRLQTGEQLAGELRKKGALKGFNLDLEEYSRSCRIEAGTLTVSIDAQNTTAGSIERSSRSDRDRLMADLDADIPF